MPPEGELWGDSTVAGGYRQGGHTHLSQPHTRACSLPTLTQHLLCVPRVPAHPEGPWWSLCCGGAQGSHPGGTPHKPRVRLPDPRPGPTGPRGKRCGSETGVS